MLEPNEIISQLNGYSSSGVAWDNAAKALFGDGYPSALSDDSFVAKINSGLNGEDILESMVEAVVALLAMGLGLSIDSSSAVSLGNELKNRFTFKTLQTTDNLSGSDFDEMNYLVYVPAAAAAVETTNVPWYGIANQDGIIFTTRRADSTGTNIKQYQIAINFGGRFYLRTRESLSNTWTSWSETTTNTVISTADRVLSNNFVAKKLAGTVSTDYPAGQKFYSIVKQTVSGSTPVDWKKAYVAKTETLIGGVTTVTNYIRKMPLTWDGTSQLYNIDIVDRGAPTGDNDMAYIINGEEETGDNKTYKYIIDHHGATSLVWYYSASYQKFTDAVGSNSSVAGKNTLATGVNSHADGENTIAIGKDQTVVGKFNEVVSDALFVVGNGTDDEHRHNAFEVIGNDAYAGGVKLFKTDDTVLKRQPNPSYTPDQQDTVNYDYDYDDFCDAGYYFIGDNEVVKKGPVGDNETGRRVLFVVQASENRKNQILVNEIRKRMFIRARVYSGSAWGWQDWRELSAKPEIDAINEAVAKALLEQDNPQIPRGYLHNGTMYVDDNHEAPMVVYDGEIYYDITSQKTYLCTAVINEGETSYVFTETIYAYDNDYDNFRTAGYYRIGASVKVRNGPKGTPEADRSKRRVLMCFGTVASPFYQVLYWDQATSNSVRLFMRCHTGSWPGGSSTSVWSAWQEIGNFNESKIGSLTSDALDEGKYLAANTSTAVPDGQEFRFLQYNVAKYNNDTGVYMYANSRKTKLINFRRLLATVNADFVLAQEDNKWVNTDADSLTGESSENWLYKPLYTNRMGNLSTVHSKKIPSKNDGAVSITYEYREGIEVSYGFSYTEYDVTGGKLAVCSIHMPSSGQTMHDNPTLNWYDCCAIRMWMLNDFFTTQLHAENRSSKWWVVGGDFNAVYNGDPTVESSSERYDSEAKKIVDYCAANSYQISNGGYFGLYTTNNKVKNRYQKDHDANDAIDFIISSPNTVIRNAMVMSNWYDDLYSDHIPQYADIVLLPDDNE